MQRFLSIIGGFVLAVIAYFCLVYWTANVASDGWNGNGVSLSRLINTNDGATATNSSVRQIVKEEVTKVVQPVHVDLRQRQHKIDYKVSQVLKDTSEIKTGVAKIQECLEPICSGKVAKPAPRVIAKVVAPAPPPPVLTPVINRPPDVVPTGDYIKIEAWGRPSVIIAKQLRMEPESCCPVPPPAPVFGPQRQPSPPPPPPSTKRHWWQRGRGCPEDHRGRCY